MYRYNIFFTVTMWIIFLLFLMSNKLFAVEYHLLELDKLSLEYKQHRNYRDAYFPQYETVEGECTKSKECMKYGAGLNFDLNVLRVFDKSLSWKNTVDMDATNRQVRQVGWRWEAGLFLGKVDIFYRHHSRHLMEGQTEQYTSFGELEPIKYPLRDEYIFRMNFYERKK